MVIVTKPLDCILDPETGWYTGKFLIVHFIIHISIFV